MGPLIKLILRWSVLGAFATVLGALLVIVVARSGGVFDRLSTDAAEQGTSQELVRTDGTLKVPEERLPVDAAQERDAPSLTLLAHRRADGGLDVATSPAERSALAELVRAFVPIWETYGPGEGERWSRALAPYLSGDESGVSARRDDLNSPDGVGSCEDCRAMSRTADVIDPGSYMRIARLDDNSAYITTQGYVRYSGDGLDRVARRGYALLLVRDGPGAEWKVHRIVAETLPEG